MTLTGADVHFDPTEYIVLVEDIRSGQILDLGLRLDSGKYDESINRPGSLRGTQPVSVANPEVLIPWVRALYVMRNGRIDWGGILTKADPVGQDVQIEAMGWTGYWDFREIRIDRSFTATDQFTIFQTLLTDAQNESVHGIGANVNVTVEFDALSGVLRDRTTEYRNFAAKNLGNALRELAASDNGFDFAMRYEITANNTISKRLRLYYPDKGRDTGFIFSYEPGYPGNIVDRRIIGVGHPAWSVKAWGAGEETARISSVAVDETKRNTVISPLSGLRGRVKNRVSTTTGWPLYESSTQHNDVEVQATLDEHARTSLKLSGHRRAPEIIVDPRAEPAWDTYGTGDRVGVRISDGFAFFEQTVRLIGYSMDMEADMAELIVQEV